MLFRETLSIIPYESIRRGILLSTIYKPIKLFILKLLL